MNVHTWERAVVAALNGIEGGKPPLNNGSKKPWTTAVLSALAQAGNKLGFYTCAAGGKKVGARWEAWLWDCVWREIQDEESWMLLSVPMVAECEWQTDGWNIRQDFHKLLAANAALRVFVFNGGDAERGREVAGKLCGDIAAMRFAPSQETRFVLAAWEVLARPAFRIFRANAQGEILREFAP